MSNKFPCIYYDNGKCQKFSDDHYTAWCDFDQCEHITPSNGDRIRGMTDEELAYFLHGIYCEGHANGISHIYDAMLPHYKEWLKQPYKEDT